MTGVCPAVATLMSQKALNLLKTKRHNQVALSTIVKIKQIKNKHKSKHKTKMSRIEPQKGTATCYFSVALFVPNPATFTSLHFK